MNTILAYLAAAAICVALFFGYGAREFYKGRAEGASVERAAWVAQREEDQAKQLAKAASDQRQIDQIEADYLAIQGQLAETQTALEEAIKSEGADQKPALPKSLARAINGAGR